MATKKDDKVNLVSFKTQYDPHTSVFEDPGSAYRTTYSSRVDADGEVILEESGSEDLYSYIQSHRDSCDINVLLSRYNNGDVSVLNQRVGSYGDFTQFPKTFADTLNFMIKGEEYFDSLDLDLKRKFDFSFEKFVATMDDMEKFNSIMDSYYNPEPSPTVSDVSSKSSDGGDLNE